MNPVHFRRRLLNWFDKSKRDLPWRDNRDPYRIWVSEVMLQQTTVTAVVPYFLQFIRRFPNVESLSKADEQDVLHLWQGLGYYRRARHLHQAARMVVKRGAGLIDNPDAWSALPGVGRYILGAVLSQAFDRRMPIIEANCIRVLSRLFGKRGDVKSPSHQKWLWQTAADLLPKKRAGDFNQSMMELGALICRPDEPSCEECPVRSDCRAFADGVQDKIPTRPAAKRIEHVREVAVVIRRGAKVLIAQRSADAKRWSLMWEFPQTEVRAGEKIASAARRWVKKALGLQVQFESEIATFRYSVTRYRLWLTAIEAHFLRGNLKQTHYRQLKWVLPRQVKAFPSNTVQRKLRQIVAAE